MSPEQVQEIERRNDALQSVQESGDVPKEMWALAVADIKALLFERNKLVNQANQDFIYKQRLHDDLRKLTTDLSHAERERAECRHTVEPLRRKLKKARELLDGVTGFSDAQLEDLRDVMLD